ncbi:MAG: hypothetical protein QM539_00525 [Alphaproteobacteria bacterium]|nr:hypothetical protein [Alphaproteobacteria bacterium]
MKLLKEIQDIESKDLLPFIDVKKSKIAELERAFGKNKFDTLFNAFSSTSQKLKIVIKILRRENRGL